jgi:glycosyltransferase involved in cell wall biosynthesis
VVLDEVEMLRAAGIEVATYFRSSDEIDSMGVFERLALPIRPIYSDEDAKAFRVRLREFRPDVVHLHNPFPLISPWVVRVATTEGTPVIQTVHNYRHSCPAGTFFRDGAVCQECAGKRFAWAALRHGCYRDSRLDTAVMVGAQLAHRGTRQLVDRYLAISDFVGGWLIAEGIPPGRVTVKPNAVRDPGPLTPPGDGFLFAARLDPEKGVELLLDAWERSGLGSRSRLVIAGDGPLRPVVERAAARDTGISYVGLVSQEQLQSLMTAAAVVAVPSTWDECFGMVAAEALAAGRPVIATQVGGLAEIVDGEVGWLSEPLAGSLAQRLVEAVDSDLRRLGIAARRRYEQRYSPVAVTDRLVNTYLEVVAAGSQPTTARARERLSAVLARPGA